MILIKIRFKGDTPDKMFAIKECSGADGSWKKTLLTIEVAHFDCVDKVEFLEEHELFSACTIAELRPLE